jgi:hypothetical protein
MARLLDPRTKPLGILDNLGGCLEVALDGHSPPGSGISERRRTHRFKSGAINVIGVQVERSLHDETKLKANGHQSRTSEKALHRDFVSPSDAFGYVER